MKHFVFTIYLAAGQISKTTTDGERKQIVGPVRKQPKCSFEPNLRRLWLILNISRKQLIINILIQLLDTQSPKVIDTKSY